MKSYLKFLSRNKLYTAIEAAGLIVSLAFVVIIGTSIRDQLRISRAPDGQENLYLLGPPSDPVLEYRQQEELAALPELLQTAVFVRAEMNVLTDGVPHRARILLADAGLLDMVPLEVRAGSPDQSGGGAEKGIGQGRKGCRATIERPRVRASAYSRSSPKPRPRARVETFTPRPSIWR